MLGDCRIIDLPKITDSRGNLTFIEAGVHSDQLSAGTPTLLRNTTRRR